MGRHDPTIFNLLAQELFQQLGILLCLRPVALAMQKVHAVEVILLECWLSLLPSEAGWDVLQDASGNAFSEKAVQLVIWVLGACSEGLHQFESKRLSGRDFEARWIFALRAQVRVCNGSDFELLRFCERMCVFGLAQMRDNVLREVMLSSELKPMSDDVLQWRWLFAWAGGVC